MSFKVEFSLVVLPHWANSFTLSTNQGLVMEQLLFNVPEGLFLIGPLCYVNYVLIGLLGPRSVVQHQPITAKDAVTPSMLLLDPFYRQSWPRG